MEQFEAIRKYYRPIQPSISTEDGKIDYIEFAPKSQLKNHIHCYWQLSTNERLNTPFRYRVVSDGCIDVFFNLKKRDESFVMGFCKQYTEFSLGKEFKYGGIRFYPSIFPLIFEISAKMLSGKDQLLKKILPELSQYIFTNIKEDFRASIPKIDEFLWTLIHEKKKLIDERFYKAFLKVLKRKGNLETEHELNTGISPRHLRRLFDYYIGTSPKSFSQVVRFQYVLNEKPSTRSLKEYKIFFDLGFFDQAHFIKNFTKFYGVTPARAFSKS